MRHKLFAFWCLAFLSVLFVTAGVLALLGYGNVEVRFWDRSPIESDAGKVAWIVVSAASLVGFSMLARREHRRGGDRAHRRPNPYE